MEEKINLIRIVSKLNQEKLYGKTDQIMIPDHYGFETSNNYLLKPTKLFALKIFDWFTVLSDRMDFHQRNTKISANKKSRNVINTFLAIPTHNEKNF